MKKCLLPLLLFFISYCANGQEARIYKEKTDEGYVIYGDNDEWYPVSVKFNFTFKNMVFSEDESKVFVLPPKSTKTKMGDLRKKVAREGSSFNYKYEYVMGNVMIPPPDENFLYDLPFSKSQAFKVYQGYNGRISHQHENALDFTMPEGTPVVAARSGTVVKVVASNTESCPDKDCQRYNNLVTLMHADGTFASYLHIKYNGAKVSVGDQVKAGDVIAESGNVGWSTGPHLHFVCFQAAFGQRKTLKTKFRIDKGEQAAYLEEGKFYQKNY